MKSDLDYIVLNTASTSYFTARNAEAFLSPVSFTSACSLRGIRSKTRKTSVRKLPLALALKTFVGDGTKAAGRVKLLLATTHGVLLAVYWRFWQGQLLPYAPQAKRALYAKLATALFLRALRQVVDSTAGDVVQLVRTLPRHSLESRTVTAGPQSQFPLIDFS